jgi:RNA polymerase sigma factor (sigma-70 family)
MSLDSFGKVTPSIPRDARLSCQDNSADLQASLDALFRAEAPPLLRKLSRRTSSHEEAMDVVQDAFLQLLRAAPNAEIREPAAYLQRIAQNLLKKRAKQATARSTHLHDALEDHVIQDFSAGPDEILINRQLLERYEAAVLRLAPKTQRIFLLHRKSGLTYVEIADTVGLSVSGVEKHMMKAIASLDRWFGAF